MLDFTSKSKISLKLSDVTSCLVSTSNVIISNQSKLITRYNVILSILASSHWTIFDDLLCGWSKSVKYSYWSMKWLLMGFISGPVFAETEIMQIICFSVVTIISIISTIEGTINLCFTCRGCDWSIQFSELDQL